MFAADTVQRERGSGSITQNFARRRSTLNVQQTIEAFKDRMVSETSVALDLEKILRVPKPIQSKWQGDMASASSASL
jgi:hypothetical protein